MRETIRKSVARTAAQSLALTMILATSTATVAAQPSSAESRRAAGEAYDRGTTAMLANDFRAAAHFFEQAYHLAPAAVALKQAVRAHDRAGNAFRAANLALRLRDQYPNDADGQALATDVLDRFAAQYTEVHATCHGCAILVNDAVVSENVDGTVRFFIQPNTSAVITGAFQYGNVSAPATGAAGATVEVPAFEAPPPPPEPEPGVAGAGSSGTTIIVQERRGTPPALFFAGLGITAALGGVTIWSGIDTVNGVDAYEEAAADPAREAEARTLLDEGQSKELRTNILIGATSAVAATTIIFAIVTDWGGDESSAATSRRRVQDFAASVAPTTGGAAVLLGGRF